jgi:hypothetical protein
MLDLCRLILAIADDLLRSRVALEAEILVLRQHINVLRRANPKRLRFVSIDRLILGGVCRLFPKMYDALAIVRPETVIRWHRAGFRSYWRWKIEAALRTTGRDGRNTPAHPPDQRRQSVVGSTENPWRASQAWHRCRSDQRGQNIWRGGGFLPRRDGGRSFITMLMGLPRWTCSWCRQSRFGCCSMAC